MSTETIKPDFGASTRHFIFTEEHEQLRETIERFAKAELAPHADEWETTTFPDSVIKRMGDLGFLGLTMPEEYGGQGGDYFTSVVRSEAMANSNSGGLNMGIAVQTDMAMPPIEKFGSEEIKDKYLRGAIAGDLILSLGITEPDAGSDVAAIKTRAVRDGDNYIINGSKVFITNGIRADLIVLVTKTDDSTGYDGFSLFLVETDTPGMPRTLAAPFQIGHAAPRRPGPGPALGQHTDVILREAGLGENEIAALKASGAAA